MSITSDIFGAMTDAAQPIPLDAIMDAMPVGAVRANVQTILAQRRKAGEVVTTIEDGTVHYAIAPGIDPMAKRRGTPARIAKPARAPAQAVAPRRSKAAQMLVTAPVRDAASGEPADLVREAKFVDHLVTALMIAAIRAAAPRTALVGLADACDAMRTAWRALEGTQP